MLKRTIIIITSTVFITSAILVANYFIMAAWTEPTAIPPGGFAGSTGGQWGDQGAYISASNATDVVVTDTGRVGIGMTDPTTKLEVRSDGANQDFFKAMTSTDPNKGFKIFESIGGDIRVFLEDSLGTTIVLNSDGNTYFNGGNVGIGDTSPDAGLSLDVEGRVGATEICDENGNNCIAVTSIVSAQYSECYPRCASNNDAQCNAGETRVMLYGAGAGCGIGEEGYVSGAPGIGYKYWHSPPSSPTEGLTVSIFESTVTCQDALLLIPYDSSCALCCL